MQQPAIEYYKLQAQNFACLIKSTIEMIDKFLGLSGKDQLSEQDKATFRAFKLLFMGQLVEDIQQDLATGRVTEETIEKRVKLDEEVAKFIVEKMNLNPMGKIFFEYLIANHTSNYRNSLLFELRMLGRGSGNANCQ